MTAQPEGMRSYEINCYLAKAIRCISFTDAEGRSREVTSCLRIQLRASLCDISDLLGNLWSFPDVYLDNLNPIKLIIVGEQAPISRYMGIEGIEETRSP